MSIDRDELEDALDRVVGERVASRNDAGASRLTPPAFLRHVVNKVNAGVYRPGQILNSQARGSLAKFWYGEDSSIHYEIWVHERTAQLELGLHCESTPEYNRALYKAFDGCLVEIQHSLGSSFWLEEWDHGWIRLYETHPLYPLDTYRVEEIATRLGEIISALQPLYEDIAAGLPSPSPAPVAPESRHRQSRWRR